MARSLEAIKTFAEVSPAEEELLRSHAMPIVLLNKSENYYLSELIAPHLHNVGVMLPYTGLHHILFDWSDEPAFVMTSGNPPSEPIAIGNEEALRRLGGVADYFLLHNRDIAYRCDDSVVRLHGRRPSLIRRSRGYAPAPVHLKDASHRCSLGVGGNLNVTTCILQGTRAFLSQHIGDLELLETFEFHRDSAEHLIRLTSSEVEAVACDLHPRFLTTKYAEELAEDRGLELVRVQHHYAHLASLIGEHGVDDVVGVICDGVGYGSDGAVWGGEIMYHGDGLHRVAHLELQPMPGGDLATKYPLRMVAGILRDDQRATEWLISRGKLFPHGLREVEVVLKQAGDSRSPVTSSCGRVLDAVSALLGVCFERTYEGEPAMKLESVARGGSDVLGLEPEIKGSVVGTTTLLREVLDNVGRYSVRDLAFSAEAYLARALGLVAVEEAEKQGFQHVGFSGGVAYNEHFTVELRRFVEERGLTFLVNEQVPCGDGGLSFGQAVAAGLLLD